MPENPTLVLTCEHGGNDVPPAYKELFRGQRRLLESHRGHDPGALAMARAMARRLGGSLIHCTVTRLLVELNRSPGHPDLFSEISARLPAEPKRRVLERYYLPYHRRVRRAMARTRRRGGSVLHVGVHSFTPVLSGRVRNADIGLLYDPWRRAERALCHRWRRAIRLRAPSLRVRMNYPYRGVTDGLTTALRRELPASGYMGIELEIGQRLLLPTGKWPREVERAVIGGLADALEGG